MKILLMEDDPVLGDTVTDYLLQYYETDRVFDSEEAQAFIDEGSLKEVQTILVALVWG